MRKEVKWKGGRFVPFRKEMPTNLTPAQAAQYYLVNISKADVVTMPVTVQVTSGNGKAGATEGVNRIYAVDFPKDAILKVFKRMEIEGLGKCGPFAIVDNQVKVVNNSNNAYYKASIPAIVGKSFKYEAFETELTKMDDLCPDPNCSNAPYARAWEKVCAKACGGKWVGALRGVQVDVIVNEADD